MKHFIIKNLKNISLVCLIATMVAIFLFSSQSAEESSKLSGRIVTVVIRIVMPSYDNLPFLEQQRIKEKVSFVVRKIAHFTEFATFGFFLMLYLFAAYGKGKMFYRFVFSWAGGTFYAVTDEIHQMFVSGRYPAITDVVIDSSGVLFGIIFLLVLMKIYSLKYLSENSKILL